MIELILMVSAFLISALITLGFVFVMIMIIEEYHISRFPFTLDVLIFPIGFIMFGAIAYKLFTVIENKYGALLGGVV